jgi:APA family basic amino acid/polyamine antiporter
MANLFIRKSMTRLLAEGDPSSPHSTGTVLKRSLTAWNLVFLGIGGIIGAGIFTLTGVAAAKYAGPGIVFSFCIGGTLCALAGVCYAEMASMVPVAGSAYAYSYTTMGELIAWIIGWDLVLEYAFGAVTVAAGWSGYFISLLHKTLGVEFSDIVLQFTKGPFELVTLADGSQVHGIWNLPATAIALLVTAILYRGIRGSAFVNNIIVVIKVIIVLAFIILGWTVIDTQLDW